MKGRSGDRQQAGLQRHFGTGVRADKYGTEEMHPRWCRGEAARNLIYQIDII